MEKPTKQKRVCPECGYSGEESNCPDCGAPMVNPEELPEDQEDLNTNDHLSLKEALEAEQGVKL